MSDSGWVYKVKRIGPETELETVSACYRLPHTPQAAVTSPPFLTRPKGGRKSVLGMNACHAPGNDCSLPSF